MIRVALLSALLVLTAAGCGAWNHPYASAHWVGSFIVDADESRSGTECALQRIIHIDVALDCAPAYVVGDVARYVCSGAGSAHYSYTRVSEEGSQHQAGTGSYAGEITGLLEIYHGRYRFDARVKVPGTYEAAKGEYVSSGPEILQLLGVIAMEEGRIPDGGRTITFDQDKQPRIESLDCRGPDAGRRHLTLSLSHQPDTPRRPAVRAPPSASVTAATLRPESRDVAVGSRPAAIELDPTTARAYVLNKGDGTVSVIDTATERVVATIAVGSSPEAIAVSAPTRRIHVLHSNPGRISVIDGRSDRVIGTISLNGRPTRITAHPKIGRVYVTVAGGPVRMLDATTNAELAEVKIVEGAGAVALNPVNGRVYVNSGSGHITVFDDNTNRKLITWRLGDEGGNMGGIAVNPRTDRVYVADGARQGVWVIDSSGTQHRVIGLVLLPREPWAVMASERTNRIYAWDTPSGDLHMIDGGSGQVATIPARGTSWGIWDIADDPATNRIYAAISDRNTVTIFR